jgi:transposase
MRNGTSSSSSTPAPVTLLGIPGLRVHEVWELHAERVLLVDTPPRTGVCTGCGQRAESKGRATVHLRDLPAAGKATRLVWVKRIWRCHDCRVSWRERHPGLPSRSVLTARARFEAARQVGEQGRAVAAVARDFGVGWETVMRAVVDEARVRFADQEIYTIQTRPCLAIGVDEKVMNRGRRALRRRRRFVTVIVDLTRGRPLDIVEGRSKKVLKAWLAAQSPAWRAGVRIAALDPAAGYRAALTDPKVGLPNAQLVLDRFHAEKLAGAAIDDCRRRVQQETTGHRGRAGDPLYETRKLLLMASERLDDEGAARLAAALAAGDPYEEVGCTHMAKELLRGVYLSADLFAARLALERFFEWAATVEVAEVTRLAKTIDRWRVELLAYFRTNRASSGPVEAVNGEIEQVDRIARGFRNFDNYRTRMLLKTTVAWHTPATPRLRGRAAQSDPAAPSFIA